MKKVTKLSLLLGLLALYAGATQAQQQYLLSWKGTGYTRNSAGNISAIRVT